jgi:hypothetical protein
VVIRGTGSRCAFARSLARCVKWHPTGGKSGATFYKTLDDRFVIKRINRPEQECVAGEFGERYCEFVTKSLKGGGDSSLCKIVGVYRIGFKNFSTTNDFLKLDVVVMENLMYGRDIDETFDLKGCLRNRYLSPQGRGPFSMEHFFLSQISGNIEAAFLVIIAMSLKRESQICIEKCSRAIISVGMPVKQSVRFPTTTSFVYTAPPLWRFPSIRSCAIVFRPLLALSSTALIALSLLSLSLSLFLSLSRLSCLCRLNWLATFLLLPPPPLPLHVYLLVETHLNRQGHIMRRGQLVT